MKQLEDQQSSDISDSGEAVDTESGETVQTSSGSGKIKFLVFFLLILLAGLAAGGYFGWQYFTQLQAQHTETMDSLRQQIAERTTRSELNSALSPIREIVSQGDSRLESLQQQQQSLLESTEKLYELYGRDENGWKLAEVEYLMSIAQHKLLLEQDFEGAALTLDAASARIAELADPGLLPVRLKINEEIAALKTRARPDLVGMTLLLSRLTRQLTALEPEYVSRTRSAQSQPEEAESEPSVEADLPWQQRLNDFMTSLVTVKRKSPTADGTAVTQIIDVQQRLEDNLKLTRWSVLERDARQYQRLMQENLELFNEYYDLEVAANADFHASLLQLQKSILKPEFPDISGSLYLLREIRATREQQPQVEAENG